MLTVFCKAQVSISPNFFGQNYWYTYYQNAPFGGGTQALSATQFTLITQSDARLVRVGGANYNRVNLQSDYSAPTTVSFPDWYNKNKIDYVYLQTVVIRGRLRLQNKFYFVKTTFRCQS
ncbi:MAG: hypothetical protein HYX39_07525 [Bacteroidetes bacterium]|nr:hypothetical protein [Bacteroidota bacterium]